MGETSARTAFGVAGTNLHTGTQGQLGTERNGVVGIAPIGAGFVGVRAYALEPATALQVDGRASFSRSGTVMVPAGRSYADVVVPDGLTAATFLVATPMVNRPGVHVQSAVPNLATGKVRIYLNRVASLSASTPIGWFAIN